MTHSNGNENLQNNGARSQRRHLHGALIPLEVSNSPSDRQLSLHISDHFGYLTIHLRKFHNGTPTREGVAFNHSSWITLMDLMPSIDQVVHNINKPTFVEIDSERSIIIEDGGYEKVKVIFKRGEKYIHLSLKHWHRLVELRPFVAGMIVEHMSQIISRLEK